MPRTLLQNWLNKWSNIPNLYAYPQYKKRIQGKIVLCVWLQGQGERKRDISFLLGKCLWHFWITDIQGEKAKMLPWKENTSNLNAKSWSRPAQKPRCSEQTGGEKGLAQAGGACSALGTALRFVTLPAPAGSGHPVRVEVPKRLTLTWACWLKCAGTPFLPCRQVQAGAGSAERGRALAPAQPARWSQQPAQAAPLSCESSCSAALPSLFTSSKSFPVHSVS